MRPIGLVLLLGLAVAAPTLPVGAAGDASLRFHGAGVSAPDLDRIKIRIDDPSDSTPGPPAADLRVAVIECGYDCSGEVRPSHLCPRGSTEDCERRSPHAAMGHGSHREMSMEAMVVGDVRVEPARGHKRRAARAAAPSVSRRSLLTFLPTGRCTFDVPSDRAMAVLTWIGRCRR